MWPPAWLSRLFVTSQRVNFQKIFHLGSKSQVKSVSLHSDGSVSPVLSEEVDDVKRRPVHQSDRQVKRRLPLFLNHMRELHVSAEFYGRRRRSPEVFPNSGARL